MDQWIRDLLTPYGVVILLNFGFFIAWFYTFKRSTQIQDQTRQEIARLFDVSDKRYAETTMTIVQLIKDDTEYKLLLTGILDRLTGKLEHPVACPFALGDKGDSK